MKDVIIKKNIESSIVCERNDSEIDILASCTYGFNPGQNIDVKTNLKIDLPEKKIMVIETEKPLLLMGSPFFKGGKLTIRLHNSLVGKYGAHIISPGERICRLTLMSKDEG